MNLKDKYNLGINRSIPLFRLKTKIRMNKLKEINGKYYQECEVLMLATDDKATYQGQLVLGAGNHLFSALKTDNIGSLVAQHLYITSNEEIKEGDWFMSIFNGYPLHNVKGGFVEYPDVKGCKKIIATTDISLTIIDYVDCEYPLPQPSKSFIQAYIKAYNEGNPIKWVNVEFEKTSSYFIRTSRIPSEKEMSRGCYNNGEQITGVWKDEMLKVDKNNYITITKVKNSWTRKEMFDCWLYSKGLVLREETDQIKRERIEFNKWIEQNL